jgi:hypothetical protein
MSLISDTEKLRRLEAFLKAATALDACFGSNDPLLVCGYPECLPDFEEFVAEVIAWRDHVKACVEE